MKRNALQAVPVYTGLHRKDAEPLFDAFLFMPTFHGDVALLTKDEFDHLSSPENLHIYQALAQNIQITNRRTKTSYTATLSSDIASATSHYAWPYCQAMFGSSGVVFFASEDGATRSLVALVSAMRAWNSANPNGNLYLAARDGLMATFPHLYGRFEEDEGY